MIRGFLAVDPGRDAGWALFDARGVLVECGLANEPYDTIPNAFELVIERPHSGQGKASTEDLFKLSMRMRDIETHVGARTVRRITPVEWKNSVPKGIMIRRIESRWMTEADHTVLRQRWPAAAKRHNVVDAIGIGIWYAREKGWRS